MSILAFDITQFFPFLNHQLLPLIMNKVGLDHKILTFFKNYLVGRKTKYFWNNFISSFFCVNIGVGQGSALSPILSIHYLSPIFHSLENCLKILKIPIFTFLLLTMDYSFLKTNLYHILMQIFLIATM